MEKELLGHWIHSTANAVLFPTVYFFRFFVQVKLGIQFKSL